MVIQHSLATPERSHQVYADLTVQRYHAGGFVAGRDRQCAMAATTMFAVTGFAAAIAWVNASHLAPATKPGPLGQIRGST